MAFWCYIFLDFFPNREGNIGHDYSYFLPRLLAGFYWFTENGFFSTPYFTPAFCGGDLFYSNPQNLYYSLPQFLTFIVNPLSAVSATFVTFAFIGYFGFYYLLRETFQCHKWAALLGAALFLFNNFYTYRIIIGHLSFHGFMLIPFIAFFLLKQEDNKNWIKSNHFYSVIPALLISYILYSGGVVMLLPIAITILAIVTIYASIHTLNSSHWKRFFTTSIFAAVFSASKLTTIIYVLNNFPRDGYKLPGIDSLITSIWIPFKSLFIAAENNTALLANTEWKLDRHAFEFGITIIPLIIISIWIILLLTRKIKMTRETRLNKFYVSLTVAILAIPLVLNFYTPEWNAILKNTPVIKNSSSLFRWYIIYIPSLIILSALIFSRLDPTKIVTPITTLLMIAFIIVSNIYTDKSFYHLQKFNPEEVIENHHLVNIRKSTPMINNIGYGYYYDDGKKTARGNDIFTHGISKLDCYQPLFGYRLEFLPNRDPLKPGPINAITDGHYNMRNPACYIYPNTNQCQAGDNFITSQLSEINEFSSYKHYGYTLPIQQRLSDVLSWTSIIISVLLLIAYKFRKLITKTGNKE